MERSTINFKVVISDPKTKKAYQKEMEQAVTGMFGKKIGDTVSGNNLGFSGYEFLITGGSDKDGFPMRADIDGISRKKVLITKGTGLRSNVKGKRKRKSIRGNTISQDISQINLKVSKYGTKSIEEILNIKPAEVKEDKPKAEKQETKESSEKPKEEASE